MLLKTLKGKSQAEALTNETDKMHFERSLHGFKVRTPSASKSKAASPRALQDCLEPKLASVIWIPDGMINPVLTAEGTMEAAVWRTIAWYTACLLNALVT
jgi:hypothetical protein